MASTLQAEWIQVRLDLGANPKVARMVDLLSKTFGSYVLAVSTDDLFSGTRPVTCPVTTIVTRHALMDVTVGGLIRTWGAVNTFIRDGHVPHAGLDWVDDQSKIPGFGKAMARVGQMAAWSSPTLTSGTALKPAIYAVTTPFGRSASA